MRCERPPHHSDLLSLDQERRSRAKEQQQIRPSNTMSWGPSAAGDSVSSSEQECNHLRQHIETLTRSKTLLHKSMLEQMSSLRKQLVQSEAEVRNPPKQLVQSEAEVRNPPKQLVQSEAEVRNPPISRANNLVIPRQRK